MFIITVESSVLPEYQYIREDRWETPVRSPDESAAKTFDDLASAKAYIERFQLGSTSHVHCIIRVSDQVVVARTEYVNNGKGKFIVAIRKVK